MKSRLSKLLVVFVAIAAMTGMATAQGDYALEDITTQEEWDDVIDEELSTEEYNTDEDTLEITTNNERVVTEPFLLEDEVSELETLYLTAEILETELSQISIRGVNEDEKDSVESADDYEVVEDAVADETGELQLNADDFDYDYYVIGFNSEDSEVFEIDSYSTSYDGIPLEDETIGYILGWVIALFIVIYAMRQI